MDKLLNNSDYSSLWSCQFYIYFLRHPYLNFDLITVLDI